MKDKKLYMIGNAHLDPVWRWNWQEGFQEVKATFRSALDRMKEDKDFIFSCSSAVYYEWIEKNNPAMFEEIRQRVAEGRWEIVGGWWIQPDCNIPSGESYVRQGLYGQRYFLEKFGKMAVTGYNVDSFGHNGNLPQILKKSGMDNYVFMRPMPHEKGLPGRIFRWKSMDGSEVLCYRIPYEYCTWGKSLERYTDRLKCEMEDGEDALMLFYGVGNHGGGPTKENIKSIHELNARDDMPVMEMETVEHFFSEIRQNGKAYAEYEGDLQHHASGCYSVMSAVKEQNRRAEEKLAEAEAWSCIAKAVEKQPYPDNFATGWKGVLFNQFHDILSGTSIQSAYKDASYLYGQAMAVGQENLNYALQAISWDIDIEENTSMRPIVVFNPHAWEAKMPVELEVRGLSNDSFKLVNAKGQVIPAQRIQSEAVAEGQSKLLFVADLPSMGYEVYRLYLDAEDAPQFEKVNACGNRLENGRFSMTFSDDTGYLTSLYDKKAEVEVLKREGGRLAVIEDKYDTWAHDIYKFDKKLGEMKVVYRRISEEGPVRSSMRVKYQYHDSYVIQEFRMYRDLPYIEVKVRIDWREHGTQLKVNYPVNTIFSKPVYEIPYGYIEKSANGEEEPGQRWFDLSGEHVDRPVMYGLAIANNAKYSYNIDVDEMNLTFVRNSAFSHHEPAELSEKEEYAYTDEGIQEFIYTLIPHEGTWKSADVQKYAEETNVRPKTIIETYHKGSLPARKSFLSLKSDHVLVGAVKESEEKDGVIVRMWETKHQAGKALLRLPFLEREAEFAFEPCEIKTVKVPYDRKLPVVETNMLEM